MEARLTGEDGESVGGGIRSLPYDLLSPAIRVILVKILVKRRLDATSGNH